MSDHSGQDPLVREGIALIQAGRLAEADALFRRILEGEPDQQARLDAIMGRFVVAKREGRTEDVLARLNDARAAEPDNANWLVGRALALCELGRHDEALDAYDQAIAQREDLTDAWFGKGQLLLSLGRYKEGWELFEWRFYISGARAETRLFPQPAWEGAGFPAQTLLIHAEQGFGDTIQFYRFVAPTRRMGGVVVEVQEPLVRLLASQPEAPPIVPRGAALPRFDLHHPLLSVPMLLGTEAHSIPSADRYLRADPALVAAWVAKLPPANGRLRVGIAWSGNTDHANDHNRSMTLATMLDMIDEGIPLVSLQKEVRDVDRPVLALDPRVTDLGDGLTDFADTAAVISQLDLVIAVDTSIAHLAGALGKPVWVLLPAVADWRWMLDREDSPWYASARLFRQKREGDWSTVGAAVRRALRELAAGG